MINPPIEEVVDKMGGRFSLVVVAARRARQINDYYTQLGEGIGHYVPPQVHTLSRKPLTIALEEIAQGKVQAEASLAEEAGSDAEGETSDEDES